MDLGEFLEKDMMNFLDSRIEKKDHNVVDREEEYGLYMNRDYLKELDSALDNDELTKAKKLFDELKNYYNSLPKNSIERKKIYSVLEKMYAKIEAYVDMKDRNRVQPTTVREVIVERSAPLIGKTKIEKIMENTNYLTEDIAKEMGNLGEKVSNVEREVSSLREGLTKKDDKKIKDFKESFNIPDQNLAPMTPVATMSAYEVSENKEEKSLLKVPSPMPALTESDKLALSSDKTLKKGSDKTILTSSSDNKSDDKNLQEDILDSSEAKSKSKPKFYKVPKDFKTDKDYFREKPVKYPVETPALHKKLIDKIKEKQKPPKKDLQQTELNQDRKKMDEDIENETRKELAKSSIAKFSHNELQELYESGIYNMYQNNYIEASKIFEKIIELRPKSKAARIRLAECMEVMENA